MSKARYTLYRVYVNTGVQNDTRVYGCQKWTQVSQPSILRGTVKWVSALWMN